MNNDYKNKPPYFLGLLCVIPLIGALVGIVLLYYGIFKYKDKFFTVTGALGIIITVSIYSYMGYQLRYGIETGKGFAIVSKRELNNLDKLIHLYKLQYRSYPDSLKQIWEIDNTALIYDPLLARNLEKNKDTKYQYKRMGDSYILFSVGIDGIPNTADDIYPTDSLIKKPTNKYINTPKSN